MKDQLTITIPLPPAELKPNARVHWARKAKAVKRYRLACMYAAWRVDDTDPLWTKARVLVRAYFPDKRRRDPDNLIASLKAAFDGLADAGVIKDDSGLWPERPEIHTDKENPRIDLVVTCEDSNQSGD